MQVKSEQNTFKQMSIKVLLNIFYYITFIKYFNICTRMSFILTGSECHRKVYCERASVPL